MSAIADWIRTFGTASPTSGADAEPATGSEAVARDEPGSSLFQCPECQSVYIAAEKTTCVGCETPVEQVAVTLSTRE